ncbi:MAG TPA: chemotaxis protein CheW [Phycisphaerae bacterium]|nr:chemotaxis protein CheW [Phycisphaerae bacterium]
MSTATATASTVPSAPATQARGRDLGGKYLTFVLADEEYGLEILKVREIIGMMDITAVPRTPEFVKGVINLRGKVIPVVDLRLKFAMTAAEATEETCIIVVDVGRIEMGIVVDKVSEVLNISPEDIEPPPSFGVSVDTNFILGMGKANNRVTILLDIGRVLAGDEADALVKAAADVSG